MTPEHDKPTHEIGHSEALVYIAKLRAETTSLIAQVEALTVPQGWTLVPMNPVVEQVSAGQKADWNAHYVTKIYQAMLDAAPTIPAIPGTKEGA